MICGIGSDVDRGKERHAVTVNKPLGQPFDEDEPPPRLFSRTVARVFRDTDAMRLGVDARVYAVATTFVGIRLAMPLDVGEIVKVELSNNLQHIDKEVRGIVNSVRPLSKGQYDIKVDLQMRLTPLEVSQLKSLYVEDDEEDKPRWL